ncbi:MAG: M13 family metallopeptidase, partial [Myxococcales bacterium]|nr:M13 family metallopeptidase [Myxococcales bacterium]
GEPAASEAGGADRFPAASPDGPGVQVTLGDVGLEAASLDRTADPCIDFYQFACGGWLQSNPVPPDRARLSRFTEIDDRTKATLRSLLEDAARTTTGDAATKKLGSFYAACMDEAAVERAGIAPLKALLAKTQGVKDAKTWLAALVELHKLGVPAVWENQVLPDLKNASTHVTYLDAAGLSLPDRTYYLAAERKELLAAFQRHVGKLLALVPRPAKAVAGDPAADVVAIETELARLTKTAVEQRDLAALYHPSDLRALAKQATSVDWPRYFQGLGTPASKRIIVATPAFFAGLDQVRAQFKPAQWASYFTYHLVAATAFALPTAYGGEAFALEKLVTGVERPQERSQRCVTATGEALGDLLAQPYVARYFAGSAKQDVAKLVAAVVSAMAAQIASLDWMTDATRQEALAKLGKITRMVGFPERWRTYDYAVKRDDFAGNLLRARAFETRRQRARAGKPVDRGEWRMNAFEVGAYYNPSLNHMAVPAGILQRPAFAPDRAVAANLGGIGERIGHELTHAFDDHGAQFDGDGNLKRWWQAEDLAKFTRKAQCVSDQYATFEVLPKKRIQAQLTLGENIADLGGAKIAFQAYRALRRDAAKTYVADGFSEDQQFFLAVAQASCSRDRPAEAERRLAVDPHAPPKFRVYGALRNMPEFAEAFRCAAGTPMRPARSCAVW